MNLFVSDRRGNTDGPAHKLLSQVNSPIPIVLMSRTHRFKFNEELLKLGSYILCEFSEMGWNWNLTETHVWGKNTEKFPQFHDEEYKKFDDWVAANPPVFTFTREILSKDITENNVPIDYPCWYNVPDPVSEKEFNNRPISCFYFWGRSHEARVKLHGRMWTEATEKGFSICDNLSYLDKFMLEEEGRKIISVWMPHYGRIDIKQLLSINNMSKLSIAMPGAGWKTFRHCEASFNSVMIKWVDDLAWSFPWVSRENCIAAMGGFEIEAIERTLESANIYEIYKAGVANCKKYQIDNYVKHIESIIHKTI